LRYPFATQQVELRQKRLRRNSKPLLTFHLKEPSFSCGSQVDNLRYKNVCQLEGSDHGGRDSAAELALAGIDVQMSNDSYNRLTLGSAPPDARNYTPRKKPVNGFLKEPSQGPVFARKSMGFVVEATEPRTTMRGFHPPSEW
jgi:hypothetical protein